MNTVSMLTHTLVVLLLVVVLHHAKCDLGVLCGFIPTLEHSMSILYRFSPILAAGHNTRRLTNIVL